MNKVIFIDDDPMTLHAAAFIAKKSGVESLCCSEGGEGLAMIEKEKPTLAFIDVEMPEMNGFEVLEKLPKKMCTEEMTVYMMSGTVTDEECERTKRSGAAGIISKPLIASELIDIIRSVCGHT